MSIILFFQIQQQRKDAVHFLWSFLRANYCWMSMNLNAKFKHECIY
jgi:hypothetical protein